MYIIFTCFRLDVSIHIHSVNMKSREDLESYELVIRAKCHPTKKKVPAFYQVFQVYSLLDWKQTPPLCKEQTVNVLLEKHRVASIWRHCSLH